MKIFNVENGVKKVYVQACDIMMLNQIDLPIPHSIFKKFFSGDVTVDGINGNDFVEFTTQEEIDFFESIDWIIDYKQIRHLSQTELEKRQQEVQNEITNESDAIYDEKSLETQLSAQRRELLKYKLETLNKILLVIQGHEQMQFPIVPDSDGFSFVGDDDCSYEIRASLESNKLLLFRKDGKKLSNDDTIPHGFLQMGISIAMMERSQDDVFFGDYEMRNFLTEDSQYFVTEFKVKRYGDNNLEEKGRIKRLLRKIFNRSKKED